MKIEKSLETAVKNLIRDVHDFPKKGILFKDITPLLADGKTFKLVIDAFAARFKNEGITKVVGIESRGFIFASALAYALGAGFVPVRKKGKLPHKTYAADFALEYGTDTVEIHCDALTADDKILLADDLLATGGTAKAALELVEKLGAHVAAILFLCELTFLDGRKKLPSKTYSLIKF